MTPTSAVALTLAFHISLDPTTVIQMLVAAVAIFAGGQAETWIIKYVCPELDLAPDADARAEIHGRAIATPPIRVTTMAAAVLLVLLLGIIHVMPASVADVLQFPLVISLWYFARPGAILLSRAAVQRVVRESLNSYGVDVCMTCGYDMRARAADRCPECGAGFVPHDGPRGGSRTVSRRWPTSSYAFVAILFLLFNVVLLKGPRTGWVHDAAIIATALISIGATVGLVQRLQQKRKGSRGA